MYPNEVELSSIYRSSRGTNVSFYADLTGWQANLVLEGSVKYKNNYFYNLQDARWGLHIMTMSLIDFLTLDNPRSTFN